MKKYPGHAALAALLLAVLLVLTCAGCSRAAEETAAPAPDPEPTPQPTEAPVDEIHSRDPIAMNTWQTLEFTLNDTPLTLPLTLEQLQTLGFELAAYEGERFRELVPGEQTTFYMTHPGCGPDHVLEGILASPGGDTPVEGWPVQAVTFTLLPQLENAEELVPPEAELANGIGLGCCMQEVFDSYGPPSELTGPEGESGWWTVRYNQDNCRRMNFLFVGDGPYLVSMQLMLTPQS